jgi:hypothetical protein
MQAPFRFIPFRLSLPWIRELWKTLVIRFRLSTYKARQRARWFEMCKKQAVRNYFLYRRGSNCMKLPKWWKKIGGFFGEPECAVAFEDEETKVSTNRILRILARYREARSIDLIFKALDTSPLYLLFFQSLLKPLDRGCPVSSSPPASSSALFGGMHFAYERARHK